jgi:hypothetical protein
LKQGSHLINLTSGLCNQSGVVDNELSRRKVEAGGQLRRWVSSLGGQARIACALEVF